jgi:hypothetical protein
MLTHGGNLRPACAAVIAPPATLRGDFVIGDAKHLGLPMDPSDMVRADQWLVSLQCSLGRN